MTNDTTVKGNARKTRHTVHNQHSQVKRCDFRTRFHNKSGRVISMSQLAIACREGAMAALIWMVVAVLGLCRVAAEKGMNVAVDSYHIE